MGKLPPEEFAEKFALILKSMTDKAVSIENLLDDIQTSTFARPYPEMLAAVKAIRAHGLKAALVTNNWLTKNGNTFLPVDAKDFDVVRNINSRLT